MSFGGGYWSSPYQNQSGGPSEKVPGPPPASRPSILLWVDAEWWWGLSSSSLTQADLAPR